MTATIKGVVTASPQNGIAATPKSGIAVSTPKSIDGDKSGTKPEGLVRAEGAVLKSEGTGKKSEGKATKAEGSDMKSGTKSAKADKNGGSKHEEALKRLLAAAPQAGPNISWNRLGLSTASSPALRQLLTRPIDTPTFQALPKNSEEDQVPKLQKHRTFLEQNTDTFLAYRWVLQALVRKSLGATGGCKMKVADVLLFDAGEPSEWILTNPKTGRVESRKFDGTNQSDWDKFLKGARKAAGALKDDEETPICLRFSSSVEGVSGAYMNAAQFNDFSRTDSMHRFQVVSLQMCIGAKCGQAGRPSERSIVYKTEYKKEGLSGATMKHTKEYDIHAIEWDTHMSNTRPQESFKVEEVVPQIQTQDLQPSGQAQQDEDAQPPVPSASPPRSPAREKEKPSHGQVQDGAEVAGRGIPSWKARKEVMASKSLNRSVLSEMTEATVRYVERSRGIDLQNFRAHFVMDFADKIWLTGASRVAVVGSEQQQQGSSLSHPANPQEGGIQLASFASRLEEVLQREQSVGRQALDALEIPPENRREAEVQTIFNELRGNHFLSQIPLAYHSKIARGMEYQFVESGLEVFYSGDIEDSMFVVIHGSVRAMLEPENSVYCRTIDLSDKDSFGEQAITLPGTAMKSQVVALQDTHLMVLKRQVLQEAMGHARVKRGRWRLKRAQLEKLRKVLSWDPSERNMIDLKLAAAATLNIYFFQSLPSHTHLELMKNATIKEIQFEHLLFPSAKVNSEGFPELFYIVLKGTVTWIYQDMGNFKEEIVNEGGHIMSIGSARATSETGVELIIISRHEWERCSSDLQTAAEQVQQQDSNAMIGGTFLTELDMPNRDDSPRFFSRIGSGSSGGTGPQRTSPKSSFNPLANLDRQKERHATCAVTGEKFPLSQKRTLQRRQVREAASHLRKRQVTLLGFDRDTWLKAPRSNLNLFDNITVSPATYDVYLAEKNMEDQEKMFARAVLDTSVPLVSERALAPSGCAHVTTNMLFSGMFIEIQKIECPSSLLDFGHKFELSFRFCEQNTLVRFEMDQETIPLGGAPQIIDAVRMSWFFCADEGINLYLQKQPPVSVALYNSASNELVATMDIDLCELANRVALHQNFRVPVKPAHQNLHDQLALQFVYFHINVGCIKFRQVETKNFRLRRRQGLYFPDPPFITECLPPDGWDPCNEEYISKLSTGQLQEADNTALSMDGTLIPRSRAGQQLIEQEQALWAHAARSGSRSENKNKWDADESRPAPLWMRKNQGSLRKRRLSQAETMISRPRSSASHRSPSHRSLSPTVLRPASAPPEHYTAHSTTTKYKRRPASSSSQASTRKRRRRPVSAMGLVHPAKHLPAARKAGKVLPPRPSTAWSPGQSGPAESLQGMQRPESAPPGQRLGSQPLSRERSMPKSPQEQERRPLSAIAIHGNAQSEHTKSKSQRPMSAAGGRKETETSRFARKLQAMQEFIAEQEADEDQNECTSADESIWENTSNNILSDNFLMSEGVLLDSKRTKDLRLRGRPSSAMSAFSVPSAYSFASEETTRSAAAVLATITRPKSALQRPTAKCVEGLRNAMPSFKSACTVSKLVGLAGIKGVRSKKVQAVVESAHRSWRQNLTSLNVLEEDLRSLDTRSKLVSYREKTL